MTPENIERIRDMRDEGCSWAAIAREIGCDPETVRRAVDPEFRAKRAKQIRECYARRAADGTFRSPAASGIEVTRYETRRDAEILIRQIPQDTRDLTASLMGDPIPGRSALDRMGSQR